MWIYRLCGFRIDHYRRQAVTALALRPGDTVVDLGCGTGLNFAMLQRLVGPSGRVIGVDLTDAMLVEAKRRVDRAGWSNVELVQTDLAEYTGPDGVGGFLSTLALTLVPEFDAVIQTVSRKLRPGGRLAVLDMKLPDGWPEWLVRVVAWLNGPYGVSMELAERHPWESVRRSLRQVEYREFYFGALYLSVGEAGTRSCERAGDPVPWQEGEQDEQGVGEEQRDSMESVERLALGPLDEALQVRGGQRVVENGAHAADGEREDHTLDVEPGALRQVEEAGWIPVLPSAARNYA